MTTAVNDNNPEIEKWKPGVPKSALLLIAGIIWLAIGVMMDGMAYSWLKTAPPHQVLWVSAFGFVFALFIHHFGFLRLVDRNLGLVSDERQAVCIFVYALEELFSGRGHDFFRVFASTFIPSQIIFSDSLSGHWDGLDFIQCTLPAIFNNGH